MHHDMHHRATTFKNIKMLQAPVPGGDEIAPSVLAAFADGHNVV